MMRAGYGGGLMPSDTATAIAYVGAFIGLEHPSLKLTRIRRDKGSFGILGGRSRG